MKGGERMPTVLIAALVAAAVMAGCGGDDVHYSDQKIIDKLNLEKSDNGYSLAGDIFCEVKKDLLNDSGQVSAASDKDELGLVIASTEGNVGVEGVPVFSPDCKDKAKKKLNKLDPKPAG
ncbi:MAG: hypothetical protein QOI10_76 [Solirubrobacterales bacterium]|jgi:hypothetical protein|nr:hypothetical protein [Solirubrobacterales bacterium]